MPTPNSSPSTPAARQNLELRLSAYSTLGAAALVTAGAGLGTSASAQVTVHNLTQFTYGSQAQTTIPPDLQIPASGSFNYSTLNFNVGTAGGAVRFNGALAGRFSNRSGRVAGQLNVSGRIASVGSSDPLAKKLAPGATLLNGYFQSNPRKWRVASGLVAGSHHGNAGSFVPNGAGAANTGYIGFKTVANGQTYLGWLRIKVVNHDASGNAVPLEFTLVDKNGDGIFGAVASLADPNIASFVAGETSAVPEPASVAGGLALFALGAVGVREFRKRRRAS